VLRLRLIFGFLLAGVVVGLFVLDAHLSTLAPPDWPAPRLGINLGRWLYNGAVGSVLVAIFVWLATHELLRLSYSMGFRPSRVLTEVGAVGLVMGPFVVFNSQAAAARTGEAWGLFLLAGLLALAFLYQAVCHRTQHVVANVATAAFIVLYTGGLAHFMCRLRMEVGGAPGVALLLFSLFGVKMTDVGAYFSGRLAGRRKLIPWLSPQKTWEGLAGGLIVAAGCALAVGYALRATGVISIPAGRGPYALWLLVFGVLMAALSTAGDLCASLIKRDAAVKDSGEALPGFGGVLDVLDSPLLASPAAWWFWTRLMHVGAGG
jgi:phosphatidate cytidylyltransferase